MSSYFLLFILHISCWISMVMQRLAFSLNSFSESFRVGAR